MNINRYSDGTKLTLTIEGRIDTRTAPELESVIQSVPERVDALVLDLAETVYISSAGLRVLLMAQKMMNRQGDMTVIHVNEDLMEIFDVTGFSDILTVR